MIEYLKGIHFRGFKILRIAIEETNTFRGKKLTKQDEAIFGQLSLFLCRFRRLVWVLKIIREEIFAGDK